MVSTIVIGDSLTAHAEWYLSKIKPNWVIDGVGGRGIGQLAGRVTANHEEYGWPSNLVVALGTNNNETHTKQTYLDALAAVPAWVNIFFVTVYKDPEKQGIEEAERCREISGWMHQMANERERTYTIPWRYYASTGKIPLRDAMHATHPEGEMMWAELIRDKVVAV